MDPPWFAVAGRGAGPRPAEDSRHPRCVGAVRAGACRVSLSGPPPFPARNWWSGPVAAGLRSSSPPPPAARTLTRSRGVERRCRSCPVPCPRRRCSPIGGSVAGAPPRRGGLEAAHAKARIGLGCRTTVGSDGGVRRGQGSNPRWTGHESALTRSVRRWPLTVKRLLRTSHESACVCPLTWGSTARALSMRSPRQGKTVAPVPARQGARRGTDGSGAAPGPRPSPGPQSSRPGLQPIPCRAL